MARTPVACPYCGKQNDIHDEIDDPTAEPGDGDCSLCFSCSRPALFVVAGDRIRLRRPTSVELAKLLADPNIRRTRAAIAESYSGPQAVNLVRRSGS